MRERVTFVHPPNAGVDADVPTVNDAGVQGARLESVREDKLTVPFDRLPSHVADALRSFNDLRLRWTSSLSYDTLDPFAARLSPGLHISYALLQNGTSDPATLCSLLQAFGPLDCSSQEAFTRLDGHGTSQSPALYYHQPLESLDAFVASVIQQACKASDAACHSRLQALRTAVGLDIVATPSDGKPQALEFKALWPLAEQPISVPSSPNRRTEVGLLSKGATPSQRQHELGFEGALAVLGQQSQLSPTAFAFPARHRLSDASFSAMFLSPTGLHPTLQLSLSNNQAPVQDSECAPYVYLTLPRTIFADRHQLADALFLASKNLTATRYTSLPVDLEAPEYATKPWGSNVLLEMAPPDSDKPTTWTAEVPLHLRYMKPTHAGYAQAVVPYPVVFWACSTDETDWSRNPFERRGLGYDELFDQDMALWHVTPNPGADGRLVNTVTVPVLQAGGASWVAYGTAAVVALGFIWVLWQLLAISWKTGHGDSSQKGKHAIKKKQ